MTNTQLNNLVEIATPELMVDNDFLKEVQKHLSERIRAILTQKHNEYAVDNDALSNFKNGAELFGETPEKVLLYYKLKHDVSIKKLVEDLPSGNIELFREKITDDIAYLILLWAHLEERTWE